MQLSQILVVVLMVAVLAGYWWWKSGRHGGSEGYIRHRLGLRAGEAIQAMWNGYYDIDRTTGEHLGQLLGVHTRGANVMVALSSQGRLLIGSNEQEVPPITLERGRVAVHLHSARAEMGSLAGPNGLEPAEVVAVVPPGAAPLRIQLARSGSAALQAWARDTVVA